MVFDMDGLLLDSERLALETFAAACHHAGIDPDLRRYLPCIGTTVEATRRILIDGFGPAFPIDEITAEWSRIYAAAVRAGAVPVKPGARALLETVYRAGIPAAVATSTARAIALHKLDAAGMSPFIAVVVAGDDVPAGKPDPAPYLEATRRLGREPRRCWALEDSESGVRSALAAGLYVIQVPDLVAPTVEVRALGHRIVDSLDAVAAMLQARIG
jgi:HAD superfamily hydrolase (TIGR01509 family)